MKAYKNIKPYARFLHPLYSFLGPIILGKYLNLKGKEDAANPKMR